MTTELAPIANQYTSVHLLNPQETKIFLGNYNLMHVQTRTPEGEWALYRGVYAVMAFPISYDDRYIALRYHNEDGGEEEIGIVEAPQDYPPEARDLILRSLNRHYFEFLITRVYSVDLKFKQLFFDVETNIGRRKFEMHWRSDRTHEYGLKGRILLDVRENRYIVEDLTALRRDDYERLTRYVYW